MTHETTAATASGPSPAEVDELLGIAYGWLRTQRPRDLAPRDLLLAFEADDLRRVEPLFHRWWASVEARLRREQRTLRQVIGPHVSRSIEDAAAELEPDEATVRAMLATPAVADMLGAVTYDAIREFLRRVDLVGNIIDKLPLLGGIRRKMLALVEQEFEARLEGQIKTFLAGFSGAAVDVAIDFVLSPGNRQVLRDSRRQVARRLLDRRVSSLVPAPQVTGELRRLVWEAVETVWAHPETVAPLIDDLDRELADQTLAAFTPDPCPDQIRRLAQHVAQRFWQSEAARAWLLRQCAVD